MPAGEARKTFQLAKGLDLQLLASEPLVRQPVCITFDDRGRLWVLQYLQYPIPNGVQAVEVDQYLRTTNPNIYAAGDVAFPQKFTHAAMATARLCVANALDGAGRPARELVVPHCTYTDPEVAQVGLTPRQAGEAGIAIDEYRLALPKVERAFIDGEEEGLAAIYARRGSGEIVGATLVAAHAGEMISELTLAMTHKVPLDVLAAAAHRQNLQAVDDELIGLDHADIRSPRAGPRSRTSRSRRTTRTGRSRRASASTSTRPAPTSSSRNGCRSTSPGATS